MQACIYHPAFWRIGEPVTVLRMWGVCGLVVMASKAPFPIRFRIQVQMYNVSPLRGVRSATMGRIICFPWRFSYDMAASCPQPNLMVAIVFLWLSLARARQTNLSFLGSG